MDKYSDRVKVKEDDGSRAPSVPKECKEFGCHKPTQVALAVVKDESGNVLTGAASEFMDSFKLRKGYEFQYWITRCDDCYHRDLYKRGKGHWSKCDEVKHLHADITLPEHHIDPKRRTPEQELRLKFIAETEMRKIAKIVGLPEPDFKHASPSQMLKQTIENLI